MSTCTFISSDSPLPFVAPTQKYPLSINIDTGEFFDGGADDNFFLHPFEDVQYYTHKKYGVWLEWNYTDGRARQIIQYINNALALTDSIELWRIWLTGFTEYEESPVIHSHTVSARDLTIEDIREIDSATIWNTPDKRHPNRPSFYRLTILHD